MPDPTLSEALKEAYASAPAERVIYITFELRHSLLLAPIRVVLGRDDIEAYLEADAPANPGELVFFHRYVFDLVRPEVGPSGVPTMTLTIDNVSRDIMAGIEATMVSQEAVVGTFREYLSDDLSGPQNDPPMHMEVMDISADVYQITLVLGFPNYQNKRFPTIAYDAEIYTSLAS